MNVILKGNGEKIICIQQKEQKVIYNGENTLIDNRMPISLSSVNTKTIELFYCICKFPLRLIVAIFDIVWIIDCCIIFALIVKISLEYHKFCNIKRQLNLQKKNKNGFVNY